MPGWPRWDGDGENTVVTEEKCPGSGGELSCLHCLHCVQHIIVCHFSGGSAAGSSGRRGLVLILSSWELGPAPWPWIQLLWGRAANNIRKHGHREKFK